MIHAEPSSEQRFIDEGWDDEGETSGVFAVQRWPVADVAIGEMHSFDHEREPMPVYAAPFVLSGRDRLRYARDYYLGTRFATGLIPADGWEDEMRCDGVPEIMIAKCRAHVAEHAI